MRIGDTVSGLIGSSSSDNDGDLTNAVYRPGETNVDKSDVGFDAISVRDYLNLRDDVWGFQSALQANGLQPTQGVTAISPQATTGSARDARLPTSPTPLLFQ